MSAYDQIRTCSRCGNEESRVLSALDAVFEERRDWPAPCGNCESTSFSSSGCAMPPLNEEILQAWANNAELNILQQDEDLMLADVETLPLLKRFIHREDILPAKRSILLSSLCILIYDNMPDDDVLKSPDIDIFNDVTEFLLNNIQLFSTVDDGYIYEYVKASVYPCLGLQHPREN